MPCHVETFTWKIALEKKVSKVHGHHVCVDLNSIPTNPKFTQFLVGIALDVPFVVDFYRFWRTCLIFVNFGSLQGIAYFSTFATSVDSSSWYLCATWGS
jgi:hypothetical protein